MRWNVLVVGACLLAGGCVDSSLATREDEDIVSSLQFDDVPCTQLITQRNQLAQRYGLGQDAKPAFVDSPAGFGPFLPDVRSKKQQDIQKASGQIDAMNRSLTRRACIKVPKA